MAMQLMSADKRLKTKEGEPILLGYDFYNGHGERLGRVTDLIVDTQFMKVPFAVVDLEKDNRRVIVPMWEVEIDRNGQRLICHDCDDARLQHFTTLEGDQVPSDLTFRVRATFIPRTPGEELDLPELPPGQPGTEVAQDARILQWGPHGVRVERVDKVRLSTQDPPHDPDVPNVRNI